MNDTASQLAEQYAKDKKLAEDYAPTLVLFEEIEEGKNGQTRENSDYHPRDIRLVLDHVSSSPHRKAGGALRVLSRRWPKRPKKIDQLVLKVWTPFTALETVARSWPRQVLILAAILSTGWYGLLFRALGAKSDFMSDWHRIVIALTYGSIMAIAIFAAVLAVWNARGLWWLAFACSFGLLPLAFSVCWHIGGPDPIDQISAPVTLYAEVLIGLFGALSLGTPILVRTFIDESNAGNLLAELTTIAGQPNRNKAHLVSLLFLGAGHAADAPAHRKKYAKIIKDEKAEYPRTAYARVIRDADGYERYVAIQYWLAYYYNEWANLHEMDWEQVTVYLVKDDDDNLVPCLCGLSVHFRGTLHPWEEVVDRAGTGPRVYVGRGSHANYPVPGRHRPETIFAGLRFSSSDMGFLPGQDGDKYLDHAPMTTKGVEVAHRHMDSDEDTAKFHLNVVLLPKEPDNAAPWGAPEQARAGSARKGKGKVLDDDFRWLNLCGWWGSEGRLLAGDASPRSPAEQDAWDPFEWLEECERFRVTEGRRVLDWAGNKALANDGKEKKKVTSAAAREIDEATRSAQGKLRASRLTASR